MVSILLLFLFLVRNNQHSTKIYLFNNDDILLHHHYCIRVYFDIDISDDILSLQFSIDRKREIDRERERERVKGHTEKDFVEKYRGMFNQQRLLRWRAHNFMVIRFIWLLHIYI